MPISLTRDRALGALLGSAVGDALGAPVDGMSHQNVRTHYRGIKGYTADTRRGDLGAGQWTAHTQRAFALVRLLTSRPETFGVEPFEGLEFFADRPLEDALLVELAVAGALRRAHDAGRRPTADPATTIPALGVWAAVREADLDGLLGRVHEVLWPRVWHPSALAAAAGQARALALALAADPAALSGSVAAVAFVRDVMEAVAAAEEAYEASDMVSARLRTLALYLDEGPLDLQDRCNGTGDQADEAFPFAVAMAARGPDLVEPTLLSAVNVGGAASAVGAMTGALLGAFNGWSAFPDAWRKGLEDVVELRIQAEHLLDALGVE